MRIAFMAWDALYAVPVGQGAVHVSSLAAQFARMGHPVHVFTRQGPGQTHHDVIAGVHIHRCPCPSRPRFIDEVEAFGRSLAHYAHQAASRHGPFDRVHAFDWTALPGALATMENQDIPLALTLFSTEWGRAGRWPEDGDAGWIAALEGRGVERADAVFALNHQVRREVETLYRCPGWKLETGHTALTLAPFNRPGFDRATVREAVGIGDDTAMLLFAGALSEGEGADRLPGLAGALAEARLPARLVVVGEGPLEEAQGQAPGVILPGARPGPGLINLYRAADLVVVPARHNPFGSAVLSAWAARCGVVATRTGMPADIIQPDGTGQLVDGEGDVFNRTVLAALSDLERTAWWGGNGRAALETAFTWEVVAQRTLEGYRRRGALSSTGGNPQRKD